MLFMHGRAARSVQTGPGKNQRLYCGAENQRLSILAYDAGRPVRHADRISAPDPENARHRRSGRCRALDYKGDGERLSDMQQRAHLWLKSLLDIQLEAGDASEFLEHVKIDLFPDAVYVFTANAEIISLPRGATALDFAYSVHSELGNQCVAVKINHEKLPLRTELQSGDIVEVIRA